MQVIRLERVDPFKNAPPGSVIFEVRDPMGAARRRRAPIPEIILLHLDAGFEMAPRNDAWAAWTRAASLLPLLRVTAWGEISQTPTTSTQAEPAPKLRCASV